MHTAAEVCFLEVTLGACGALHLRLHHELAVVVCAELPGNNESLLVVESYIAARKRNVVLVKDVGRLELVQHDVARGYRQKASNRKHSDGKFGKHYFKLIMRRHSKQTEQINLCS